MKERNVFTPKKISNTRVKVFFFLSFLESTQLLSNLLILVLFDIGWHFVSFDFGFPNTSHYVLRLPELLSSLTLTLSFLLGVQNPSVNYEPRSTMSVHWRGGVESVFGSINRRPLEPSSVETRTLVLLPNPNVTFVYWTLFKCRGRDENNTTVCPNIGGPFSIFQRKNGRFSFRYPTISRGSE